jgi:hypothetical protein
MHVLQPVQLGDVLGIPLLLGDLGAVVVDRRLRPGIEIAGREVEETAVELDVVGRAETVDQRLHLLGQVLEADLVGIVVDEHGGKTGRRLDHAAVPALLDRAGEALGHEIQLQVHLVAELDQHVAIAARQEFRFLVNHVSPLPSSRD